MSASPSRSNCSFNTRCGSTRINAKREGIVRAQRRSTLFLLSLRRNGVFLCRRRFFQCSLKNYWRYLSSVLFGQCSMISPPHAEHYFIAQVFVNSKDERCEEKWTLEKRKDRLNVSFRGHRFSSSLEGNDRPMDSDICWRAYIAKERSVSGEAVSQDRMKERKRWRCQAIAPERCSHAEERALKFIDPEMNSGRMARDERDSFSSTFSEGQEVVECLMYSLAECLLPFALLALSKSVHSDSPQDVNDLLFICSADQGRRRRKWLANIPWKVKWRMRSDFSPWLYVSNRTRPSE